MNKSLNNMSETPKRVNGLIIYQPYQSRTPDGFSGSCPICKTENRNNNIKEKITYCQNCGQPLDWSNDTVEIIYNKPDEKEYKRGLLLYFLSYIIQIIAIVIEFILIFITCKDIEPTFLLFILLGLILSFCISLMCFSVKIQKKIPAVILYTRILKKNKAKKITRQEYKYNKFLEIEIAEKLSSPQDIIAFDLSLMNTIYKENIPETIIDFTKNELTVRDVSFCRIDTKGEEQPDECFKNPYAL